MGRFVLSVRTGLPVRLRFVCVRGNLDIWQFYLDAGSNLLLCVCQWEKVQIGADSVEQNNPRGQSDQSQTAGKIQLLQWFEFAGGFHFSDSIIFRFLFLFGCLASALYPPPSSVLSNSCVPTYPVFLHFFALSGSR